MNRIKYYHLYDFIELLALVLGITASVFTIVALWNTENPEGLLLGLFVVAILVVA